MRVGGRARLSRVQIEQSDYPRAQLGMQLELNPTATKGARRTSVMAIALSRSYLNGRHQSGACSVAF